VNWDFVNANFAQVRAASSTTTSGEPEIKNFLELLNFWFGKKN
jgi:hypothetical protein